MEKTRVLSVSHYVLRVLPVVVTVFLSLESLWGEVRPVRAGSQRSAEGLYESACSSCHGFDGKGAPPSQVGFDIPLPDFTDCSFASREPDGDWIAVAHEGGPVRGFSKMMPAFGEALGADDLQLIMNRIRSFCVNNNWPSGELNLPLPQVTEKAYPEDEAVLKTAIPVEGAGAVSNKLIYEKRIGAQNQLELVIPFGWKHNSAWDGGIGDIAVGVKRVLFHSLNSGSIVSVTGEMKLPTGNEDKGFGAGTTIFEPFLTFSQILPSDSFFHFQGGVELPADTEEADREAFWRFAFGRTITEGQWGRSWSPMVEVLGWRDLACGEDVKWDLLPQVQVTLNTRQHVMFNIGVRLPITDSADRDTQLLIYLLWDWFDGGFFEGW